MVVLRSIAFGLAFYAWTFLVSLFFGPVMLAPDRWALTLQRVWSHGIIWLAWHVAGMRYQVKGFENVPKGPVLIASKHQSAWDTAIFQTLFFEPAYVLKKELLRIPLFGAFCVKMGMIPVDREGGGGALRQMMQDADQRISAGRSIIIFPEGTRMPVGEHGPFFPGVGGLYRHLNVPLVPVALNSGLYWPKKGFLKFPGVITIEFLPAIPPGLDRRKAIADLEEAIETASARLAGPAPK